MSRSIEQMGLTQIWNLNFYTLKGTVILDIWYAYSNYNPPKYAVCICIGRLIILLTLSNYYILPNNLQYWSLCLLCHNWLFVVEPLECVQFWLQLHSSHIPYPYQYISVPWAKGNTNLGPKNRNMCFKNPVEQITSWGFAFYFKQRDLYFQNYVVYTEN